MRKSKEANDRQFGSKSKDNRSLLAIKDNYRIEKELQNNLIREQKLAALEQDNKISQLQNLILAGAIISLLIVGFLFYRFLRIRYKAEKKILKQQQEMEIAKTKEVLIIKNKELTTSALQAIEKDELMLETKEALKIQKKNPSPNEIAKIIKKLEKSTNLNWSEFEMRFLAVNQEFYATLKSQFPSLSQNDHKICALIKLNFSSKDMAKLLGITVESVHTSRYRIRKKMDLDRSINMEDFIAGL